MPFVVWWVMHYLGAFTNLGYRVFVIRDAEIVVHHSCVFPRYFRFPFMAEGDLQIGDTWTAPEHRGKGLATFALRKVVELCAKPGRKFWYVVADDNIPSIRVGEKVGFTAVGKGTKKKRFGVSLLGSYVIQSGSPE